MSILGSGGGGGGIGLTLGVNVVIQNVISQTKQHILCSAVAFRKRRAHIRWEKAQDVPERHFVVYHLVFFLRDRHIGQILVRPCMARNLMAGLVHSLEELRIACGCVVDLAFAHVVAGDEECCFGVVLV